MALLVVDDGAGHAQEAVLDVTPAVRGDESRNEVGPAVIATARRGDDRGPSRPSCGTMIAACA